MDLGETTANIYNTQFTTSNGGLFPDNNAANDLFTTLTTNFSEIRNINNANSVLASAISLNFLNGQDYEKLERARKIVRIRIHFTPSTWLHIFKSSFKQ